MDKDKTQYWERLDVSLEDILEETENIREKIITKVVNKLGQNDDWLKVLRVVLGKEGDLQSILSDLYAHKRDTFYEIYASAKFSDRIVDQSLIRKKADRILTAKYSETLALKLEDPKPLTLPLFLVNADALVDLYYDDLLGKSSIRSYFYEHTTSALHDFSALNKQQVQRFIQGYERTRRKSQRRRSRIWWLINEDGKIKIFFRREKKGRTAVRKVDHNEFIKTADWKIFVFSENGKKLDVVSNREPKRAVKIANYVASQIFGIEIAYEEKHTEIPRATLQGFVTAIKTQSIDILELRVRNAPIDGSPYLDLRSNSSNSLNKAVTDLAEINQLNLLSDPTKIQSAKIRLKGKTFNIKFEPVGSYIRIVCRNKGYGEKERRVIEEFFNSLKT